MKLVKPTLKKLLLVTFIYYLVTSVVAALLGSAQEPLGIPDVIIEIAQFGPTIGVLAVLLFFRKGVRPYLALNFSFEPYILRRLAAAVGLVVVIIGGTTAIFALMGKDSSFVHPSTLSQPFWIIVIAQFIGAAGEELGWRAFLQPYLQTRFSVLTSSITVGMLWAIWHIGVFAEGLLFSLMFVLSTVAISIIIGELLRGAKGSNQVIATTFHALINLGLLLFFSEENGDIVSMASVAGVCVLVAMGCLYTNRTAVAARE